MGYRDSDAPARGPGCPRLPEPRPARRPHVRDVGGACRGVETAWSVCTNRVADVGVRSASVV